MSVLTISLGETTQLQVKVPVKGETNWSESFKTEFAQKIVEHDHTGNGKGAKIGTAALEDDAVTTAKITDSSVTTAKIADDAVTGAKIADNSITSAHIAADVVIDADIAPDSVGTSELKVDAVETENILDANVTTAKIADANVTAAKIGSDVVLSTLNDVSSSSPTAGQVLKWSGSEWAPGTDASAAAGTVFIANQTDASAYSPTAGDVVVVTAAVSFTQDLSDITIIADSNITINYSSFSRCKIRSSASVTWDSGLGPASFAQLNNCDIQSTSFFVTANGSLRYSKVKAQTIRFTSTWSPNGSSTTTAILYSTLSAQLLDNDSTGELKIDDSQVNCSEIQGHINNVESLIQVAKGTSATTQMKINGTTYLNGDYPYPFTVDNQGVNTNIAVHCKLVSNQSITTSNSTKIVFDNEIIDSTSSFASGTFTAKVKGFYKVNANVYVTSIGTSSAHQTEIRSPSNSNIYAYVNGAVTYDASTNRMSSFGAIVELEVGEIVEVFSDSLDSSYSINSISNLNIEKIN